MDRQTEKTHVVRDGWIAVLERTVLAARGATADRDVPFAVERLATIGCLLFLVYPVRELWGMHLAPERLCVALTGMAIFVSIYIRLMFHGSFRAGPLTVPAVRMHVLLLMVLVTVVLFLTLTYSATWLWFVLYANFVAGMKLPTRVATVTISGLTLLAFAAAATTIGWGAINSSVSTIISVSILMIGASRLMTTIQDLRTARQEITQLAASEAVAEERLRFARDLHDLLGHSLSAITLKVELARRTIAHEPERAARELDDTITIAREALRETRETVRGYRQRTLAAEIGGARELLGAAGIACHCENTTTILPLAVETVLAWAVREGVTNVVRHSRARHCAICIADTDGWASVAVTDDGAGAPPPFFAQTQGGNGLRGLAERAACQGGQVEAGPMATGGFCLRVSLPRNAGPAGVVAARTEGARA